MFTPAERMQMAREGCSDLSNVLIHPTGPYMVSSSTFPTYFIKDKHRTGDIHCELDVRLFGEKIAPALGITRRYVGTEPNCAVTAQYNAHMKQLLPHYGVELVEVERRTFDGSAISASIVREKLAAGDIYGALALLEQRAEAEPKNPENYLKLAKTKVDLNTYKGVISDAETAIRPVPLKSW